MSGEFAYHFNSTGLNPGSVILPGNWGRIIRKAKHLHNLWTRETALEQIRLAEFASCPSRLDCAFFFERADDAIVYAQADFSRYVTMLLYQVRVLEPTAARHHADWNALPGPSNPTDPTACRAYWNGVPLRPEPMRRETLSITPLEIISVVEVAPRADWNW